MACCGKKRAADRLARGESQPETRLSPPSAPAAPSHLRRVRLQSPAPVALASPKYVVPVSPYVVAPAETPAPYFPGAPPQREELEQFVEVEFQYTGNGRLTVTGPITGTVYYFSAGGEIVAVHGADAPSLAAVPGLRAVS